MLLAEDCNVFKKYLSTYGEGHNRINLRHSINWWITEWSENVTEWHNYAIQSDFSDLSVTFQMTEWQRFILWILIIVYMWYIHFQLFLQSF